MTEQKNQNKTNWFKSLQDKINALSEQFELDEIQMHTFRDFIVSLARDQYKAGNKSGARWAFAQAKKGQEEPAAG